MFSLNLGKLAAPKVSSELQAIKLNEAQRTVQKLEDENKKQNDKIKVLEEKITKITTTVSVISGFGRHLPFVDVLKFCCGG